MQGSNLLFLGLNLSQGQATGQQALIACSRVNFCGIGSGTSGGGTFRTIGMLHLLAPVYRRFGIMQQRR